VEESKMKKLILNIYRYINWYLRHLQCFGIYYGNFILLKRILKRNIYHINIPGIKHPLYFRPKTTDGLVFDQIFLKKEYDIPNIISEFDPKVIIDAGANVGFSAVLFANKFPLAKIVAIEPDDSNFQLLKLNTSFYPNIININAALWGCNSLLKVLNIGRHWGVKVGELDYDSKEKVCAFMNQKDKLIKTVTIEDILKKYNFKNIDILKMDIEGAEKNVFELNTTDWIDKVNLFIIEFHERYEPGCSKAFYSAINHRNYLQYVNKENFFIFMNENYKTLKNGNQNFS
jgi:FkbM family methyltransferase